MALALVPTEMLLRILSPELLSSWPRVAALRRELNRLQLVCKRWNKLLECVVINVDTATALARSATQTVVLRELEKVALREMKKPNPQSLPLNKLLLTSARRGHVKVVRLLSENGADLETKDKYGNTPLCNAARRRREAVVRVLLKKGADTEATDKKGETVLSKVVSAIVKPPFNKNYEAVVRLLAENGANLEARCQFGMTSLYPLAANGIEAIVRILLEKGAHIEARNKDGTTSLSQAARNGHEAVVRLLLENGADLEARDNRGLSVLSRAAEKGQTAIVELLLEKGAVLEARDDSEATRPSKNMCWIYKTRSGRFIFYKFKY